MAKIEACFDVVELSTLLQCVGFSVKSLEMNMSSSLAGQEAGARTITISCQRSGVSVVLEGGFRCSCPAADLHNSGVWQVTGVAAGRPVKQEFGSSLLCAMDKVDQDNISRRLGEIMLIINEWRENERKKLCQSETNVSVGSYKTTTPDKGHIELQSDAQSRYRSLDALTSVKATTNETFPSPGNLAKDIRTVSANVKMKLCRRESTYSVDSTHGNAPEPRGNKTSSPNQDTQKALIHNIKLANEAAEHLCAKLQTLKLAQEAAENLCEKLKTIINEYPAVDHDSSICSLASDISRISLLKPQETSKTQYASSPNIYYHHINDSSKVMDGSSNSLSRSASNKDGGLSSKLPVLNNSKSNSKISRIGNMFKTKTVGTNKYTVQPKTNFSPNISSGSKNKYSHVKSTIPKPAPRK